MPNRVQAEPASSATPESADSTRLRPAKSAPTPPTAVRTGWPASAVPACAGVQRLGDDPDRGFQPVRGDQLQGRPADREPAGRTCVGHGGGDHAEAARGRGG